MTLWVVGTAEIGQVGEGRGSGLPEHNNWRRLFCWKGGKVRICCRWDRRKRGRRIGLEIGFGFMNCSFEGKVFA